MKSYTRVYMKFFDYGESDYMPCELCGLPASDLHHIHARSQRKDLENDITNLMALCRKHHEELGDKKQHLNYLQDVHNEFLNQHKKQ